MVAGVSSRRAGLTTLLVALGMLTTAWLALALPAPPLYDGVQLPPGPYRYLSPAPGQKGSPTRAHQVIPLVNHQVLLTVISTAEQPPQARLTLQQNAFKVPKSVNSITVTIDPVPEPAPLPSGSVQGNVYRFSAVANDGAPLTLRKGGANVDLRGTGGRVKPVIEEYIGGRWVPLPTGQFLGILIYTATAKQLGYFALVVPGGTTGTGGPSFLPFVIIAAIIIVIAAIAALLVTLSRQRRPPTAGSPA
jgi:hypothetical protein